MGTVHVGRANRLHENIVAPYTGSLDLKHNAELGQGLSEDVAVYAGNFTYGVAAGAIGLPERSHIWRPVAPDS